MGHFSKKDNFCDFWFAFLYTKPLLKWGLLWNQRIYSPGSKCFPLRVNPINKRSKNISATVASLAGVSILLKYCIKQFQVQNLTVVISQSALFIVLSVCNFSSFRSIKAAINLRFSILYPIYSDLWSLP